MNTFKLVFEETCRAYHKIIIDTELSQDELLIKLEDRDVKFLDHNIWDCASELEDQLDVAIKNINEGDPFTDEMECVDVSAVKGGRDEE